MDFISYLAVGELEQHLGIFTPQLSGRVKYLALQARLGYIASSCFHLQKCIQQMQKKTNLF